VREELTKRGLDDMMLFGGGIIPDADAASLKAQGLAQEIFTPGTTMVSITEWLAAALDNGDDAASA
jgi:methylmalonyl-CoA mutase C-terminal domain/subunit